ncbi:MAG: VWA domain-containing protein, partial [Thermodesulfobacteriota bacterium]
MTPDFSLVAYLNERKTLVDGALDRYLPGEQNGPSVIVQAIRYSLTAFAISRPELRVLIVVTDGEQHAGDALAAAREVATTGVKIFRVGMGRPEGELIPIADAEGRQTFLKDREGRTVKSRLNETLL